MSPLVRCLFVTVKHCETCLVPIGASKTVDLNGTCMILKKVLSNIVICTIYIFFSGSVRQCRKLHGPAITLYMSLGDKDVSVDLAAAVKMNLLIPPWHGWPRAGARWPSAEKVERIEKIPLTMVAKKDFYWMYSFTGRKRKMKACCANNNLEPLTICMGCIFVFCVRNTYFRKNYRILKYLTDVQILVR